MDAGGGILIEDMACARATHPNMTKRRYKKEMVLTYMKKKMYKIWVYRIGI